MPLFGNMFGRASASQAQAPKAKAKRRAFPLRDPPPHDEEEASDFPVEQVNDEASTTSHPPENADMEVEPAVPKERIECAVHDSRLQGDISRTIQAHQQ